MCPKSREAVLRIIRSDKIENINEISFFISKSLFKSK